MDYQHLFRQLDEHDCWEFPSNFDYDCLNADVRGVWQELQTQLARPLVLEDGSLIQDASFHADVILVESRPTKLLKLVERVSLRFSNFGRLVAATDEEAVPKNELLVIKAILRDHGFIYVPTNELDKNYDGVIPDRRSLRTWWIRYFDYQ